MLRWLVIERSHGVVWAWTHRLAEHHPDPPTAQPTGVTVDETTIRVNGEWRWLYHAIDFESKLVIDVQLFGRRGTDPAAEFLHWLGEKHDLSEYEFPVDGYGYLTALARLDLGGRLEYSERNYVDK